ncbi:urease accessory protein UreE [Roseovarius aestuariivivens]|uniref:urease accessory protein UreE n=1 Tax=Roseovarius aestuariivivens TaxID=1888910 RepID=UPI001080335F|nr:urease accessory protein UreE [Roseovarius aestuariivivens]
MTRPAAPTLPAALTIERKARAADATVSLTYEDRFLRRKVLVSDEGVRFLVNLEKTTSLNGGDAFVLEDNRRVAVIPADEDLLEVTGPDLTRLAWHIGNRHTPCQIEEGRLLIQKDHVLRDMLKRLGAVLHEVCEPFTPEGGAYGMGRTHGHSH